MKEIPPKISGALESTRCQRVHQLFPKPEEEHKPTPESIKMLTIFLLLLSISLFSYNSYKLYNVSYSDKSRAGHKELLNKYRSQAETKVRNLRRGSSKKALNSTFYF